MRVACILAPLVFCTGFQSAPTTMPALARTVDATGCVLEHVAVEAGISQYQYDSFSADGSMIGIGWDRGPDARGAYLLDLETWARTDVPGFNNGASFSPDGRYLLNAVYVSDNDTDIGLYERDTGVITFLAAHEAWDWLPSFSPDGSKVLFNSYRAGNSDIYLYDMESGELDRLTEAETYEAHGQFSPQGDEILYHEQVSGADFNIHLMTLADGKTVTLGTDTTEESYPSWSPDGRYITFASDRDQKPGVADIFIMSRAGEVLRKITNTPYKDGYPFWSPDGAYLYFTSYGEAQGVYRTKMTDLIDCQKQD